MLDDCLQRNDCYINIIQGLLNRNEASLSELYDITLSKIYGLALKITRRHDLAEEVVEDTYIQAWQEITKFDHSRGPMIAWLMVICRTRAIDALRRLDEAESHADPTSVSEDSEDDDKANNPLDILLVLESESDIHIAIQTLSALQRQLVALAFFKGYTHDEIALHIKMPLGTVKSNIKRAQDKLRVALLNMADSDAKGR